MEQTTNDDHITEVEVDQTPETYYHYPGPQEEIRRSGGTGCWLIGALTLLIASVLIIAGLFLPPISLGERLFQSNDFAMFDPQAATAGSLLAVEEKGLTLLVDPAEIDGDFGVALSAVSGESLLADNTTGWIRTASAAKPVHLVPQSTVYTIEYTGTAPSQVTLTIAIPDSVAAIDVLDLYGWDEDRNTWYFIPSHPTADGRLIRADMNQIPAHVTLFQATPVNVDGLPTLMTTLDVGDRIAADVLETMDIVSPTGRQPALIAPSGDNAARATLVGLLAPGYETERGYKVMPVVRNFTDPRATDVDTVISIISDPALRNQHIQQLADFANASQFDGLMIDYRDLPEDQRENFNLFINALAKRLAALNIRLGVILPAAEGVVISAEDQQAETNAGWRTGAYDWRAIGQAANYVVINFSLDPAQFTPGEGQFVEEMMRWAVGEISRDKILGGLTALSIQERNGRYSTIGFNEALAPLGNATIEADQSETGTILPGSDIRVHLDGFDAIPGVEDTINTPYIIYNGEDGSEVSRMWLTTMEALQFRIDRLASFGIRGVAFNDLLAPGVMEQVAASIDTVDAGTGQPQLVLNWRIEDTSGTISQFTTRLNEEAIVTLQAEEGNYAVNVEVASGGVSSARGGVQVALALPTQTPTPQPTATPTQTPSPTPTLSPVQRNASANTGASSGSGAPAVSSNPGPPVSNPGAGSIGGLEIGGHVTGAGSARAQNAMRSASMTWMKVQIRFAPGADTSAAAGQIQAAHGAGFKILIGLVGSPGDLAAGGADYIRRFGEYAGSIAALGPDAIEIWNEPNIAREWPEGQINGSNYTALLASAYQGIKSTNGSVMVVSAALAPTGAEPAFPGRVVNDDNFIRQMVAAGALNVMDCLGMHYNEGIVSAYATSGDPRDSYYTRYLPTMLNYYWDLIGGGRPICITELGYLTPEGYGALPDFFSWAAGNTIGEHAAWLAEAAAVSAQSGKVRLMIVWNVDFENYTGTDPMAGYAIIRADGSCPACGALAGAR